ncbi:MAG: O-antigen ligase family protein [Bacteroidetes bacterium]|nr:O-antigen ligase family protein [Bacteroidota bacterium]
MVLANVGSINIYIIDIVYILIMISVLFVVFKQKIYYDLQIKIFFLWMVIAIMYGMSNYGYRAIGEARYIWPLYAFFIPMVFLITGKMDDLRKFEIIINKTLLIAAIVVSILFIIELFYNGRFFLSAAKEESLRLEDFRGIRYLGSDETFTLSAYAIFILSNIIVKKRTEIKEVLTVILLIMIVIFTKNRAAPVSVCIGMLAVLLIEKKIKYLFRSVMAISVTFIMLIIIFPSITGDLFKAFSGVVQIEDDPTGYWRFVVQSSALLQGMETPIFGQGFGGYFEFYVPELDKVIEYPPHNMYIFLFLKSGLIGLSIFLVMLYTVIISSFRLKKITELDPELEKYRLFFLIIFISQIPYMMAYNYYIYFGLFVGFFYVFKILIIKQNQQDGTQKVADNRN